MHKVFRFFSSYPSYSATKNKFLLLHPHSNFAVILPVCNICPSAFFKKLRFFVFTFSSSEQSSAYNVHRLSYVLLLKPLFSDTFQTMPMRRGLYAGIRESCRAVPCTPDDFQESTTCLHSRHIPLTHPQSPRQAPALSAVRYSANNYAAHTDGSMNLRSVHGQTPSSSILLLLLYPNTMSLQSESLLEADSAIHFLNHTAFPSVLISVHTPTAVQPSSMHPVRQIKQIEYLLRLRPYFHQHTPPFLTPDFHIQVSDRNKHCLFQSSFFDLVMYLFQSIKHMQIGRVRYPIIRHIDLNNT